MTAAPSGTPICPAAWVGLGYGDDTMTQQVSDELKAEVEALAEKIIAGEIEVESTR